MHVTDPHLFAAADGSLRGTVTQASLQKVLDHIVTAGWPADFVAMTGDLIQDDSAEAYERFCRLLSPLALPVHCLPGNHDVRSLMKPALQRDGFHYCEDVEMGNWQIINLDSCIEGSAGGEIAAEELQRLRDTLASSDQENALVCLHHPPLPMGSRWLDTVGLKNADEFFDVISTFPQVRGAIFGHVHQAFDTVVDGMRIIATPSTCRQFLPGSDEFAVDEQPPAYRRISLHGDGTIDAELIWVE